MVPVGAVYCGGNIMLHHHVADGAHASESLHDRHSTETSKRPGTAMLTLTLVLPH